MDFWNDLGAVVLDMDGVIYVGNKLRRGVRDLIARLEESGIGYGVLTNRGTFTAQAIADFLAEMGLTIAPAHITNSSELIANYVRTRLAAHAAFTLGGAEGLTFALQACGIAQLRLERLSFEEIRNLVAAETPATYPLLIGWTSDYNYDLATKVVRLEKCISDIYVAGTDRVYPDEPGLMPGTGWVSSSVGSLLDKTPINVAKPDPFALDYVLSQLAQPAARTAVIGDSLSDVQAGNQAGCRTVLVLGGVTSESQLASLSGSSVPHLVIRELTELL